jgi:hypothetical protein
MRLLCATSWRRTRLRAPFERVSLALWRAEHLAQERWLDIRLPALVIALDGLVVTGRAKLKHQFGRRVSALAAELGVPDVTENLCRELYDARSQGLHGARIDLLDEAPGDSAAVEKTTRLQAVLRAAIRKSIEDAAFRAVFSSQGAIKARWPA